MSGSDLPIEIYLNIFERLNRSTLKECLYVCKKWNYSAAQFYYQNIVLLHAQIAPFARMLKKYPNNNISRCARKLTFTRESTRFITVGIRATSRSFQQVLLYLPYVTIICLTDPGRDKWYLKNLANVDSSYMSHVQQINLDSTTLFYYNKDIAQLYYNHLSRLSDTITHLQLHDLQPSICKDNDFLSYISQFTRLTHLTINKSNIAVDTQLPTLSSILKACSKHLQNFCLHDKLVDEEFVIPFLKNANYFPTHLTQFQLRLTHLFSSYINYIIHNIPSNRLNALWLDITDDYLTDWIASSPLTMVDQFLQYLGSLNNLKFTIGKGTYTQGTTLTRDQIPQCFGTLHSITRKIINNRPLFLEMKFNLNGTHRKPNTSISVENNKHIQLKPLFRDPDWYPAEENIDIMNYIALDSLVKWEANAFQLIKWYDVPLHPDDITRLLLNMIGQCAHLHHFFITNSTDSFAAGPSTYRDYYHDIPNIEYISNLTKTTSTKTALQIPPTKENLKYMSFENTQITDDLLQLLVHQELDIKRLRFSRCAFDITTESNVTIDIGNSVSTLILTMEVKQYSYVFLEFEYDQDTVAYYQSHKKTQNEFEFHSHQNYDYNRYVSPHNLIFRVRGAGLNQIFVTAEYAKNKQVLSKLYPKEDLIIYALSSRKS